MNRRFLAVLAFALVVSAAAGLIVYALLAARATAPRQAPARLLVAARTLPVGSLIRPGDVRLAEWRGPAPALALAKAEEAVGRGVAATIYESELVLESRLAPKGAGAGLAAAIPSGLRAVAVRVNELVGVSGFVVPGMRVDVVISGNPPGGQAPGGRARTILQDLEVLSAGQSLEREAEGKPMSAAVVNLLATPEQAEQLALAGNEARIQLVLRNPADRKESRTPGATLAQLFSGARPSPMRAAPAEAKAAPPPKPAGPAPAAQPSRPPQAPPLVMEVLHGASRAEVRFRPEEAGKP